jgi:hypothetical protein
MIITLNKLGAGKSKMLIAAHLWRRDRCGNRPAQINCRQDCTSWNTKGRWIKQETGCFVAKYAVEQLFCENGFGSLRSILKQAGIMSKVMV